MWIGRSFLRCAIASLLLVSAVAWGQEGDVRRVHDPAIIAADGAYWVFSTGGGIRVRRSADLFRWESQKDVFPAVPQWAREAVPGARDLWAPDISYVAGEYRLYYSVSTFGSNRSCIGLATNKTLAPRSPDFKWVDQGKVVESKAGDDFNAIDPNFVMDEQGQGWLAFGSFWGGIKLCRVDVKTGKTPAGKVELIPLAARRNHAIEAPFIIRRDGWYYLFASFDLCCRGSDSTYRIMVGRSHSVRGPYKDADGVPMLEGGGTQVLATKGAVRGPGHNSILQADGREWLVHHYYDADERGVSKLQIRSITWDKDGWPTAGKPLAGPMEAGPATRPVEGGMPSGGAKPALSGAHEPAGVTIAPTDRSGAK